MEKVKILAITSCFGLGPVGKLASIVSATADEFEWYASGQKFDFGIFEKDPFKEKFFTEDEQEMQKFVEKHGIKYALVVLKNKYARFLISIGVKVIYVDSLPFMWTEEDASVGKVPFNVDVYCAQKSLDLNERSQNIFSRVKNLVWVNPITPIIDLEETKKETNYVLINLGGLHSPHGDGEEYYVSCIEPLIEILHDKLCSKIIVSCSSKGAETLRKITKHDYVSFETMNQKTFLETAKNANLFFTSPGLTTIVETMQLKIPEILLPPQNLSQFYNAEFAKKNLFKFKEIRWNDEILNLKHLSSINDKVEGEIVKDIYDRINILSKDISYAQKMKTEINEMLDNDFIENENFVTRKNGTLEVIEEIKKIIKKG